MNGLKAILLTVLVLGVLSPSASARQPQKGDQKPDKEVKHPEKKDKQKPPPSDSGKKGKP